MSLPAPPSNADLGERLFHDITASWKSQVIAVAAHLGLADLLAEGARSAEELAASTRTNPSALHRLLQALVTLELCSVGEAGFTLTPPGALLRTDAPGGLRDWATWWGFHLGPIWQQLLYSIETGKSARALLTGTEGFQHLENDPAAAAIFHRALAQLSRLTVERLLRNYNFAGIRKLVDVGGGSGQTLAAILTAHPDMSGVILDLSHAQKAAEATLAKAGLSGRGSFMAGDFFVSVEPADAYLLKSILHDWTDARCLELLRCCRRAADPSTRLLVIEQMLPDRFGTSLEDQSLARSDLNMLVALGAAERTEVELRALLQAAGFSITRVLPLGGTFTVIEAVPSP